MEFGRRFAEAAHIGTNLVARQQNAIAVVSRIFHSLGRERRTQLLQRCLAWLLIIATIPVGITGVLFEHTYALRANQVEDVLGGRMKLREAV